MYAEHRLSATERSQLSQANRLLTRLTETHSHACECHLCEARLLTDTQDAKSWLVHFVPSADDRN